MLSGVKLYCVDPVLAATESKVMQGGVKLYCVDPVLAATESKVVQGGVKLYCVDRKYIFKDLVLVLHCPLREIRVAYLGKPLQRQEKRYPFLSVRAVFPCVQTAVLVPLFGIFNVRKDADACDCTQELCGHCKRV